MMSLLKMPALMISIEILLIISYIKALRHSVYLNPYCQQPLTKFYCLFTSWTIRGSLKILPYCCLAKTLCIISLMSNLKLVDLVRMNPT